MTEAMLLESLPWESDETEDWESDEAIAESDDGTEDIGERARRSRRRRTVYYRPGRGVRGLMVRGQDGRSRNLPFPAKLATAEETNRGLANQEIGRRALDQRLERLETKFQVQQKNDGSAAGLVTLLIGGGLTAFGAFKASEKSGALFGNWANENSTKIAAVTAVSQIATSGAKLAINGRYHRSGLGIAADAFAAAQLAAFAFGSLHKPRSLISVLDIDALIALGTTGLSLDTRYVLSKTGDAYETFVDSNGKIGFQKVSP